MSAEETADITVKLKEDKGSDEVAKAEEKDFAPKIEEVVVNPVAGTSDGADDTTDGTEESFKTKYTDYDTVSHVEHETIVIDGEHHKDDPITILVRRNVRIGKFKEFEEWLERATANAKNFPGYESVACIRPRTKASTEYLIVVRFSNIKDQRNWFNSSSQQKLLMEADKMCYGLVNRTLTTGFEPWIRIAEEDKPGATGPPKWKMWLTIIMAIYPTSVVLSFLWAAIQLERLHPLLAMLVSIPCVVFLMNWFVMPHMTRLLWPWLYPKVPRPPYKFVVWK